MKCRICDQEIIGTSGNCDHHLKPGLDGTCLGCFVFGVEMQLFLIRARNQGPMGDWTTGWLREIIKDPKRYL